MGTNLLMKYNIIFIISLLLICGYLYYNKYLQKQKEHFQISKLTEFRERIEKYNKKTRDYYYPENKDKKKKININKKYIPVKPKKIGDSKILITGSTRGLGFQIAKEVNKHKPILIIHGKTEKNVNKAVEKLKKSNENVFGFVVDFSEKNAAEKLYNLVNDKVGVIDVLINNAFMAKGSQFLLNKNSEDWNNEFNVNINSAIMLSQKFAYKMRIRNVTGRIINISSYISKSKNTMLNSGSQILFKNMLEKFTNMFAEELYNDKIAVTTIRIDELLNTNFKNFLKNTMKVSEENNKLFGNFFGIDPKDVMPVVNYTLTAPFHEISGKVISTKAFDENKKLSKIVPSHNLKLNKDIYKQISFTKTIKRDEKGKKYLVKQNPFKSSPRIKEFLASKKSKMNRVNNVAKYDSILDNVIAKKLKVEPENIVFFKNEYDAIKKIIELLVPKYQDIISEYPAFEIMNLVAYENKIEVKYVYSDLVKNKYFKINYDNLLSLINTKTKLIYLSSPNIVSGQHILNDEDFKKFIKSVPDNIPIVIDQRYLEFATDISKESLKPLKYLNKENIIILRTFNNFYSIENLELTYIITNKDLAKFIRETQIINPLDKFVENMALQVYNDKYYDEIREKMKLERERIFQILDNNNVEYLPSDTYFFLIKTNESREDIIKDLENMGLIMYVSVDMQGSYWTLPLSTPKTNQIIMDVILSNN